MTVHEAKTNVNSGSGQVFDWRIGVKPGPRAERIASSRIILRDLRPMWEDGMYSAWDESRVTAEERAHKLGIAINLCIAAVRGELQLERIQPNQGS